MVAYRTPQQEVYDVRAIRLDPYREGIAEVAISVYRTMLHVNLR